jgi:2-oxoglutarate ferredoxin oxidoreductase subunit beta
MSILYPTPYLDETQLPYLFCPGCGHGHILDFLHKALVKLEIDPHNLVIVTDIGCAGLSDKYFLTNTFHGLHGRSVTYATGIKLANPNLKVIVLMGDGGCGIGGHHLINAARRNIGVTVIVFNNLNYGMTGGEHSVTTPTGGITATTRYGQLEHPLDICGTVMPNGASFVARTTSFDKKTPDLIVQAIQNDGFSLIDIWELCTAHYVPNNRYNKKALLDTLEAQNLSTGLLINQPKPEYSKAYRSIHQNILGEQALVGNPIEAKFQNNLTESVGMIIAGAAGTKIGSAASLFAKGALLSGLCATQRDDYPVTVKSGHSISEIILSPKEIRYTGITTPNYMVVLFSEGLDKTQHLISRLTPEDSLYLSADLPPVNTQAKKIMIDFKTAGQLGIAKEYRAVIALGVLLHQNNLYPLDAFKEAIVSRPRFAKENLEAVQISEEMMFIG